ncbi:TIGR00297 family protein [Archaeoglobus sulfaticallidus]|nr:TIGR00297 family protein [Archaeoglobus sulfaticallidus]
MYAYFMGDRLRIGIYNLNRESSYLNSYLLALILILASFKLKYIAGAAMFILVAYELRKKTLFNIMLFSTFSFAYFVFYFKVLGFNLNYEFLFFLSLIGGLTASLVESVDVESDKRTTTMLAVYTVFLIFNIYGFSASFEHLIFAFAISLILSIFAMKSGIADESGLMSATLIGTLMIVFTDIRFFGILLSFYIIGSFATKYRYSLKQKLGVGEPAGGARGYANVFANSLPALFFAMNYGVFGGELFLVSFVASIAAALGDTMASEIGKTSDRVYLITNFKRVNAGVSGGISVKGELSAFLGSFIVAMLAIALSILTVKQAMVALISGLLGVHVDSVLGATLEKKGYLTNSGVNFLATLSTVVFCYFLL